MSGTMNIGMVAQRSEVPAKTIRYYESIGLLPEPKRSDNGYRNYDDKDVETLRFINRARSLGFAVKDVSNLLDLWRDKQRASADVKALAQSHIAEIDDKILQLQTMRDTLRRLVQHCHGDARPDCPILDEIAGHGD